MLTDSRVMGEMLVCKAVRRGDIWVTWAGPCSAAGVHIVVLSQQMSRIVFGVGAALEGDYWAVSVFFSPQ